MCSRAPLAPTQPLTANARNDWELCNKAPLTTPSHPARQTHSKHQELLAVVQQELHILLHRLGLQGRWMERGWVGGRGEQTGTLRRLCVVN